MQPDYLIMYEAVACVEEHEMLSKLGHSKESTDAFGTQLKAVKAALDLYDKLVATSDSKGLCEHQPLDRATKELIRMKRVLEVRICHHTGSASHEQGFTELPTYLQTEINERALSGPAFKLSAEETANFMVHAERDPSAMETYDTLLDAFDKEKNDLVRPRDVWFLGKVKSAARVSSAEHTIGEIRALMQRVSARRSGQTVVVQR